MQHTTDSPIGVFDSGIGGLTVANAIVEQLPQEAILYFGDTAHLPYGDKSADAIRYYALRIVKFLLDEGCKMIVIACNSASSAAYHVLLDFYKEQALFVNVVDPLVDAVLQNGYNHVGMIATKATVHSGVYARQLASLNPDVHLFSLATPLLAPMIEEGYVHNQISQAVIQSYLENQGFEGTEALLLACTHYPLIHEEIADFMGPSVAVLDSTDVVAKQVEQRLKKQGLLRAKDAPAPTHRFIVSDYTDSFAETAKMFYGSEIELEHLPIW